MSSYTTNDIRNIALVGHAGSGKTILADAILQKAGVIPQVGSIERGTTTSDYDQQEKDHQYSLSASIVSFDYKGKHVNLVDTPGSPDFLGQSLNVLPAVETFAVVVNAHSGIEMITRRMMEQASERKLSRMVIVNKIDAENINLEELVGQIRESFGSECMPINLPTGGGTGVVDVLANSEGEADFSSVEEAHTAIIDQIVEMDEELMEKYLEEGEVKAEDLRAPFAKALREGHLIPICFTSGQNGVGVGELVEFIVDMAISPAQGNPKPFVKGEGDDAVEFVVEPDATKSVIAHVFKVVIDPFVGKMTVLRIHRGTITKDTQLYINGAKKPFKVGHLFKLEGKKHREAESGISGDICALAKVDEVEFDAVLHDSPEDSDVRFVTVDFPKPMYGLAVEPKARGDEQKMSKALSAVNADDPCIVIDRTVSGEMVIRGLGDLHMRIILEKIKQRYNLEFETHPPRIAYHETITGKGEGHHRHKKQTGGAGQFGEVYLRIEPVDDTDSFEFVDDTFGGSIPQQFLPAIEKGIRRVLLEGAIAGYPMGGIRVSVYDGKHHPVDSKEVAFVAAGRRAFIDAVTKAKPTLLEPIVNLEITVPDSNMGDIAGDLSSKRGQIQGTDTVPGGMLCIKAKAPLSELGNYQSQIKSVTGGLGSYSMEFSHYEAVPPNVQQAIVAKFKPKADED